jgi:hypothetical protein
VRSASQTEAQNANYVGGDVVTGANDARQLVLRGLVGSRAPIGHAAPQLMGAE